MPTVAYRNRTINPAQPVQLYRNLHKEGVVYSVRQKGLVVAHTTSCTIRDAQFKVNEKGRQRVIKSGRKEVHAVVQGYWIGKRGLELSRRISYNPRKGPHFVCGASSVFSAKNVSFTPSGVFTD